MGRVKQKEIEEKHNENIGKRTHLGRAFIFMLLLLGFATFWISLPLITSLAWAVILAYVVSPVKRYMERTSFLAKSPNITAGIAVLLICVGILVPLVFLGNAVAREAAGLYRNISGSLAQIQSGTFPDITQHVPEKVLAYLTPILKNREQINALAGRTVAVVAPHMGRLSTAALQWTGNAAFEILMVLFFAFFFVRDGKSMIEWLRGLLPLAAQDNDAFLSRADVLLRTILEGVLLIVAIQAFLGSLGWWFVGLPRAALAGVLMFLVGLFPAGTAIVWGPASLYLFVIGDVRGGLILLLWGTCVTGLVDNLLRPFLMTVESVPTLAILIGLIGGLLTIGFLGIFFGPLVVVLFLMMLDFYKKQSA